MTRTRRHGTELTPLLEMALAVGPMPICDEFSDEDLVFGWELHGAKIMRDWEFRHASRPWGWWQFEKGGPPPLEPGANEIRLAELGELTGEELADLRGVRTRRRRSSTPVNRGTTSPPVATGRSTRSRRGSTCGGGSWRHCHDPQPQYVLVRRGDDWSEARPSASSR